MTGGVFVTGATGTVGKAVAQFLLARHATVVDAALDAADLTHLGEGLTARHCDFSMSPDELGLALEGCDRVFLMRPPAIASAS